MPMLVVMTSSSTASATPTARPRKLLLLMLLLLLLLLRTPQRKAVVTPTGRKRQNKSIRTWCGSLTSQTVRCQCSICLLCFHFNHISCLHSHATRILFASCNRYCHRRSGLRPRRHRQPRDVPPQPQGGVSIAEEQDAVGEGQPRTIGWTGPVEGGG